jgi:hypothetical protein
MIVGGWMNQQMILETGMINLVSAKGWISSTGREIYMLGYERSSDGMFTTMILGINSSMAQLYLWSRPNNQKTDVPYDIVRKAVAVSAS